MLHVGVFFNEYLTFTGTGFWCPMNRKNHGHLRARKMKRIIPIEMKKLDQLLSLGFVLDIHI